MADVLPPSSQDPRQSNIHISGDCAGGAHDWCQAERLRTRKVGHGDCCRLDNNRCSCVCHASDSAHTKADGRPLQDLPDQGADRREEYAKALEEIFKAGDRGLANPIEVITAALRARDEELAKLRAQVGDYENCISWGVSCIGCANSLDKIRFQEERAEKAEAELASAQARIDRVRELHRPATKTVHSETTITWEHCASCGLGSGWPCPTIRTLDGREVTSG